VEQRDSGGRPDHLVAKEYWQGFLSRERSIFVDLFYGQLKSNVQCTRCKHVSITFDPYNVLSVPIPSAKRSNQLLKGNITIPYVQLNI
jgi:ubiquitin C-terminal hydrolase